MKPNSIPRVIIFHRGLTNSGFRISLVSFTLWKTDIETNEKSINAFKKNINKPFCIRLCRTTIAGSLI
jgi:hypothetical protein